LLEEVKMDSETKYPSSKYTSGLSTKASTEIEQEKISQTEIRKQEEVEAGLSIPEEKYGIGKPKRLITKGRVIHE
jgi:hypothetical protein